MTVSEYKWLPTWSTTDMNPCACGGKTALFYDENEKYRVECADCNRTTPITAKSMMEAKQIWNGTDYSLMRKEMKQDGICDSDIEMVIKEIKRLRQEN